MKRTFLFILLCINALIIKAQDEEIWKGKFEQLAQELPTPNLYRSADGAPGPHYWQQQADYKIEVVLNDENQSVSGKETITYHNNSPQPLEYLWLQLDQNRRASNNDGKLASSFGMPDSISSKALMYHLQLRTRDCGMHITKVTDEEGKYLQHIINKTMMRIDLPEPLQSGEQFSFKVEWWFNLNNRLEEDGRGGFEYFPDDDNYLYTIAQFYPRMAVYDDFEGWQNKQFLGSGEFALTFGNYDVKITTPDDHLLIATGSFENPKAVLSKKHYKRFQKAKKSFDKPIIIANESEAKKREAVRSKAKTTWHFKAEKVRDFAFASSRKFIWDMQAVKLGGRTILAQSLYPKEGNPLWEEESTKAVVHTLKTYSKYTFDYPYPAATSVHASNIGMEYPMICFNFGRPYEDGTYSDNVKYGMLSVIIHEVGHNFFPMIVNSDERQWCWMDEGLNTFLEYLTQKECYDNFPLSRGPAKTIVDYMRVDKKYLRPIMTNPEQIVNLGNNSYGKPAAALNILRETVLGKDLFDKAFKTYSQRWAFKHPKPADFFRCMEDASGVDLDWFWRGWFYTVDHVDISIDTMKWFQMEDSKNMTFNQSLESGPNGAIEASPLNQLSTFKLLESPDFFYGDYRDRIDEVKFRKNLKDKEFYQINFSNIGGLVMPILLEFEFESGRKEKIQIPVEVWRYNEYKAAKVFIFDEKVVSVKLDPELETADTDRSNNSFPRAKEPSRFDSFKNN